MLNFKIFGLATLLLFGLAVIGLPAPASNGSAGATAIAQADDDDDDDGVRSRRWRDRGNWRERPPRRHSNERRRYYDDDDDDGPGRVYRGWRGRDDDDD